MTTKNGDGCVDGERNGEGSDGSVRSLDFKVFLVLGSSSRPNDLASLDQPPGVTGRSSNRSSLPRGIDVNSQNVNGCTALMFAYTMGRIRSRLYGSGVRSLQAMPNWRSPRWSDSPAAIGAGDAAGNVVSSVDGTKRQELTNDGGTGPHIQKGLRNHTSLVNLL